MGYCFEWATILFLMGHPVQGLRTKREVTLAYPRFFILLWGSVELVVSFPKT